jgi:uncharacterized protein with HEPN domain
MSESQVKKKRVFKDYLNDIKTSISEIREFTTGMTFEEFSYDRKTIHAVIRCFEIIGEAVKNLPGEIKAKCPEIPWREVAGMRDKIIHEYFGVSLQIIWQTIEEDLSSLESAIGRLIDEAGQDQETKEES